MLGDGVGDDAAERVAACSDFLELVVAELAVSERVGQGVGNLDLKRSLDGLDWVWLVGLAYA